MTEPMKHAAHAAWRRDREDDGYERGFRAGFRAGADEVGQFAWHAGFDEGWQAHRAKARKAKRRAVARVRVDQDELYRVAYADALKDHAFVVRRLKQRLAELEQER